MEDRITYLQGELNKAKKEVEREESRKQMEEAAQSTRDFLDAMIARGIPEDKAWKLLLTMLKNQ